MDFMTLLYLAVVAFGGVSFDVYQNPQTLSIEVETPGPNLTPSLDKSFVALVVREELDHIARLRSLLAHPTIKSADDKDLPETVAEAVGGAQIISALSAAIAEPPSTLKFAILNDEKKLVMYVTGHSHTPEFGEDRFDIAIRQRDTETPIELMKRSAMEAAAHIDPYITMLYLIQRGNEARDPAYFNEALKIADRFNARYPAGRYMLLARLTNLVGIVQCSRGDYAAAQASFATALDRLPKGNIGPTFVLSTENEAFAMIALGKYDAASGVLAGLLRTTNEMEALVGTDNVSTEGVVFQLERQEVDRLLVTAYQLEAAAAMGEHDYKLAEERLAKSLRIEPNRVTPLWMLANLEDLRGDRAAAEARRMTILELKPRATAFLEFATSWSSLYFEPDKVDVMPSLYVSGPLPAIPHP